MTNQSGTVADAAPFFYALIGTVFLAIGGMLFVNLNEDPEIFMVFSVAHGAQRAGYPGDSRGSESLSQQRQSVVSPYSFVARTQ